MVLNAMTEGGGALEDVCIVLPLGVELELGPVPWDNWLVNRDWMKLDNALTMLWNILVECSCMS